MTTAINTTYTTWANYDNGVAWTTPGALSDTANAITLDFKNTAYSTVWADVTAAVSAMTQAQVELLLYRSSGGAEDLSIPLSRNEDGFSIEYTYSDASSEVQLATVVQEFWDGGTDSSYPYPALNLATGNLNRIAVAVSKPNAAKTLSLARLRLNVGAANGAYSTYLSIARIVVPFVPPASVSFDTSPTVSGDTISGSVAVAHATSASVSISDGTTTVGPVALDLSANDFSFTGVANGTWTVTVTATGPGGSATPATATVVVDAVGVDGGGTVPVSGPSSTGSGHRVTILIC